MLFISKVFHLLIECDPPIEGPNRYNLRLTSQPNLPGASQVSQPTEPAQLASTQHPSVTSIPFAVPCGAVPAQMLPTQILPVQMFPTQVHPVQMLPTQVLPVQMLSTHPVQTPATQTRGAQGMIANGTPPKQTYMEHDVSAKLHASATSLQSPSFNLSMSSLRLAFLTPILYAYSVSRNYRIILEKL